jgi:hypothetical protein
MENNPYTILGVSPAASKAEITKAVAVAMKRKQYPVDAIAKAQRSLMKSEERIIADYLRPILPTIKRFKYSDLSALEQPAPTLELLCDFDGLDGAIAEAAAEENLEWLPLSSSLNMTDQRISDQTFPQSDRPVSADQSSQPSSESPAKQDIAVTI